LEFRAKELKPPKPRPHEQSREFKKGKLERFFLYPYRYLLVDHMRDESGTRHATSLVVALETSFEVQNETF
jgi:hypothetical protein